MSKSPNLIASFDCGSTRTGIVAIFQVSYSRFRKKYRDLRHAFADGI